MSKSKECECLPMYSRGYEAGRLRAIEELTRKPEVLLTEEVLDAIAAGSNDAQFHGYWSVVIYSPLGLETFSSSRWRALLDALVVNCGVKVATLKFNLNHDSDEYEIGMWES